MISIDDTPTDAFSAPVDLSEIPTEPGVYLMKGKRGEIIYVGKAKNLRKRVASYFSNSRNIGAKTAMMIRKIARIETVITRTENEALILESNLIKLHRPKYNVNLKDDKRYPSLRLDLNHPYPNLTIVRKIKKDGAMYFGPFSSAKAVRQTLKLIQRHFKLRKCHSRNFNTRTRPCLNCQMGLCDGPCNGRVSREAYDRIVKEVILFLKGRTPELVRSVKEEMAKAAEKQEFERAAVLRDKIFALEATLEKQQAVTTDFKDRDFVALAHESGIYVVTLLSVRGGFLLGSRHFEVRETLAEPEELTGEFIRQYYRGERFVPKEILTAVDIEDAEITAELLSREKGEKVLLYRPRRGEKRALLDMAVQNAEIHLKHLLNSQSESADLLRRLQTKLKLIHKPERIECFDISNIQGTNSVAGMVVFRNGKPEKSEYRTFALHVAQPDDYAAMAEVLTRRFQKKRSEQPTPDLLMVDGGKGQLNIALSVLESLGLSAAFDVAAIAKKDEEKGETEDKIFKPGRSNPINFTRDKDLLLFLQRVRDEAHRFSVAFHRKRRGSRALASVLDDIPGIGKKRKKSLITYFKSMEAIRAATPEEIGALPGMNRSAAESLLTVLKQKRGI